MNKKIITIFGFSVALAIAGYFIYTALATSNPHSWTNGLVGYWNFDGPNTTSTNGVKDTSGNNNWGTFSGGVKSIAGISGQALNFDGVDDYITVPDNASLDLAAAGTVEAWVKLLSNTHEQTIIFKRGWGGPLAYGLQINNSGSGPYFYFWVDDDGSYTFDVVVLTGVVNLNQWYHVVGTWDTTAGTKIYLDGTLATSSPTAVSAIDTGVLSMGDDGGSWQPFGGDLDEVRIYNRALGADEVKQHYDQTKRNLEINQSSGTPPVGWWKMDEGTGQAVKDSSVNGNNGTVSNSGYGATSTDGKIGKALSFDGTDDYVDVGNAAIFNFTTAFTVEAWVKVNDLSNYRRIVSKFGNPSLVWILSTDIDRKVNLQLRPGPITRISASALTAGNWYHITAVYLGSTNQDIYINGVLDNGAIDGAIPASINVDTTNVLIGSAVTSAYPMNGLIDDVRIYNYARTANQIAEDFRAGAYRTMIGSSVPSNWWTGDLVGYWNFDGQNTTSTNGTRDTSGQNNWGTFYGGVKPAAGISGQALSFDGVNDYINAGGGASLDIINAGTIEAWIKSSQAKNTAIVCKGDNDNNANNNYILRTNTSNNLLLTLGNGITYETHTSPGTFSLNTWQHAVVTWDSSNVYFYVNGVSIGSRIQTIIPAIAGDLVFSKWGSTDYFFNGLIDEVRIYNRALSAEEVMQQYQQTRRNINL